MTACKDGHDTNVEEAINPPKCCWKFNSSLNRFLILFYIIIMTCCEAIIYDTPGSLEIQIENTFSIKPYEYEYLYSVFSFPNIVLCFFNGLLIDRYFGVKITSYILCTFFILGQVIMAAGAFTHIYWLALLGRCVCGLGQAIGVVALYYAALWFAGNEMNFVFGLLQSVGRLGTSFAFLVLVHIYDYAKNHSVPGTELGATFSVGIACSVLVLILSLLIGKESERNGKIPNKFNRKSEEKDENKIRFKDILYFPLKFWLVNFVLTSIVASSYVFVSCSQQILMTKYNYSAVQANQIGSIFNIVGAVLSPVPGLIVDKLGRELWFIIFAYTIGIISQMILAFTQWNPYIPIIIFAVSIATLNACCWPLTALVVQSYQLATAYGVNTSCMNLCLTISSIVAGLILGKYGYIGVCLFYIAFLVVGLTNAIILTIVDNLEKGTLNLSASQKLLRRQTLTGERSEPNSSSRID